jgi:hypothetical protein
MTIKNAVIWDVMLYGSCKNWHLGGTYHLHKTINQQANGITSGVLQVERMN